MDYTQNYHLPQWDKNDRVLMEDFNQMCERIDGGIRAAKIAAETTAGQISQVDRDARSRDSANAASASAALKTGLFRAAYNHYHAVAERDPLPQQNGLFFQKLLPSCATQTGFSGFRARNGDAIWAGVATNSIVHKTMETGVKLVQYMEVVSDLASCKPLIVDISPQEIGYFSAVSIAGNIQNVTQKKTRWHVKWENLDTHRVEWEAEDLISLNMGNTSNNVYKNLHMELSFQPGNYRLTVTPLDNPFTGTYSIHEESSFYVTTMNSAAASFQQTIHMEEAGSDGMLSLVCQNIGGTIKLTWDGTVIRPYCTHSYTDAQGRAVQELEFRKGSGVGTSSTVKLDVSCKPGEAVTLYDWGVMLI